MKSTKKILLLSTMSITLLIHGCSVEQSDKNNIINNINDQTKTKKQEVITARVYITNDNKEGITILENKLKDITREIIIKSKDESNIAIMIYSNDILTDIRIHKLGEEFINMNFDIEKYLEKYIDHEYVKVLDKLETDKGIILEAWESEGIPSDCITYRDSLGNLKYYLIQYNGKG